MKLRPAIADDAPGVAEIWNELIRETAATFNSVEKTPDELVALFAERPAQGSVFLIAEDAGEILGFATYFQFRGGVGYARTMEHSIHLTRAARGKGVGRALMTALETHAAEAGVHSMWTGVSGENIAGIKFHQRLGCQQVARLPEVGFKFGRWMDLVLLQKIL